MDCTEIDFMIASLNGEFTMPSIQDILSSVLPLPLNPPAHWLLLEHGNKVYHNNHNVDMSRKEKIGWPSFSHILDRHWGRQEMYPSRKVCHLYNLVACSY